MGCAPSPLVPRWNLPYRQWAFIGSDLLFMLDVGVQLRTRFWSHGMLETDSRRVTLHYAEGRLVPDLLTALPLAWLAWAFPDQLATRLIHMLRVVKPASALLQAQPCTRHV